MLLILAAFAHFLIETDWAGDVLRYAEAWDYLRDSLLLILSHHLEEEDEALALLICPTLCVALIKISQIASPTCKFQTNLFLTSLIFHSRFHPFVTLEHEPMLRTAIFNGCDKPAHHALLCCTSSET